MKALVIVESPTKANTIRQFLPKGYVVDSSMGHVRDLPASAKEIPAKYKKEKWANLGVNVDEGFKPLYVIPSSKKKVVKKLKEEMKKADELILATDEDREGEGISWHLIEVLKPKIPYKRMVFHEITQEAVEDALEHFRDIDMNLVNAQETRRIIDRLAGYTISPLLWKKVAPGLSAGRVQSVAVEFLVERERERMRFRNAKYYDLEARLSHSERTSETFHSQMVRLNGKRLASGKDFDENTGKLKKPDSVELLDEKKSAAVQKQLDDATWQISEVEVNKKKRHPAPPFITSTLQQEANRKFGMSARDTMRVAQNLYENGYITYMRTDSTFLSKQAIKASRGSVNNYYGQEYLSQKTRVYKQSSKGAQEAHEAIRPAGSYFRHPKEVSLGSREFKLYDLIWKRTLATQMAVAELEFTNVTIEAKKGDMLAEFRASGKKILFPGFFRAYVEGSDDPEEALENQEAPLPELAENDPVTCHELETRSHETKPPARYTEATLVKELEKRGVGRPSTYATIIGTIQERGYAQSVGKALAPTFTAFAVNELLEDHFPDLVDSDFTSKLESQLDEIASGNEDPESYLASFYKGDNGLANMVEKQEGKIDPREAKKIDLPLEELNDIQIMIGRFGPYVQKNKNGESLTTSLPADLTPSDLNPKKLEELLEASKEGPQPLGYHPDTDQPVYQLNGRYGPYVQLGDADNSDGKPKRVSLPKGLKPEDVDLDTALRLLELPRTLGNHPETGKEVKAGIGRYGPFVLHDGTFKSLTKNDNVLTVDLDRAVQLLQAKQKRSSSEIKDLGKHPESGKAVKVMDGRYGPYIKHGRKNISLPDAYEPDKITMEQATEIITEKAGKKKGKSKGKKKK